MIISTGRYRNNTVANLAVNNLPRKVIVPSPQSPYAFQYTTYLWTGMDRPDSVAQAFYGDPTAWWHIADANPEIPDWSLISIGTLIRVPMLTGMMM